jgi:hypothetical protein
MFESVPEVLKDGTTVTTGRHVSHSEKASELAAGKANHKGFQAYPEPSVPVREAAAARVLQACGLSAHTLQAL